METAALGCPVGRSSTVALPEAKPSGALLRRAGEGTRPYVDSYASTFLSWNLRVAVRPE